MVGILTLAIGALVLNDVQESTDYYLCASGFSMNGSTCCQDGYAWNTTDCANCTANATDASLCSLTENGTIAVGTTSSTSEVNDTIQDGLDSILELSSWFDTIAVVIAAVIILGLIFLLFKSGRI